MTESRQLRFYMCESLQMCRRHQNNKQKTSTVNIKTAHVRRPLPFWGLKGSTVWSWRMWCEWLCNGPWMVTLLVCACPTLKWCVVGRVHDRKPVLTEDGTVCPSEVAHKLAIKKKAVTLSRLFCSIRDLMVLLKHSYLDAVPHVLFAGLVLQYLGGVF